MSGKRATTGRNWLAGSLATIITLGVLSGCQPVFMSKDVYDSAHSKGCMLPAIAQLEDNHPIVGPVSNNTPAPPNVDRPERKPKHITLQYALALALENGAPSGRAPEGQYDDNPATFTSGSMNVQTDRIRVLALNPAIYSAAIEGNLARFEAVWVNSMNWTNTDSLLQGFQQFSNGQGASFNSSIVKAFADGSVANVSFLTNYTNLSQLPAANSNPATGGFLNPLYQPTLSFGYEVPLWRDAGVDINQLLSRLPSITGGSLTSNSAALGFNGHQAAIGNLGPGFGAAGNFEGILISKLRFDQSRTEFERNVHVLVKNTELAYWTLYNKYGQLYSFEENLRILQRGYQEAFYQWKAGKLDPYKYEQAKGQYEEFRGNRIQALQEVLTAERNLRGIVGLPVEDGERLIPITPPTLAEMKPDWDQSLKDTLNLRPELVLARDNLRYHQYLLTIQKNNIKPDLRFIAKAEPNGTGSTLTGNGQFLDGSNTLRPNNAFTSLAGMHYIDYQVGLFMNVPLGFQAEFAAIRGARLQLAQSYYFLRDQEDKATSYLSEQWQETNRWWRQIEASRSERLAYLNSLKNLEQQVKAGRKTYGDLEFLAVQRSYAAALVKEYNAIAEYNNTLARLEFAKGTTLRYNNIHISEGALPECAQVRATKYEADRARALVLLQRPDQLDQLKQPGQLVATKESDVLTPNPLPPVKVMGLQERQDNTTVTPALDIQPNVGSPFTPGSIDSRWAPAGNIPENRGNVVPAPMGRPAGAEAVAPTKTPAAPAPLQLLPVNVAPLSPPMSSLNAPGTLGYVSLEDLPSAPFLARGMDGTAPANWSRQAAAPVTLAAPVQILNLAPRN